MRKAVKGRELTYKGDHDVYVSSKNIRRIRTVEMGRRTICKKKN
jgi:hypothetical protein